MADAPSPISQLSCLNVVPLGFAGVEVDRLGKIFEPVPSRGKNYAILHPVNGEKYDILLVNYDNPSALAEKDSLLARRPNTPVVAVSRGPLTEPPEYHLRGMLIGVKVLGLLDKIPHPSCPPTPLDNAIAALHKPKPISKAEGIVPFPFVESQTEPAIGYHALVVDDSVSIQKSLEIHLTGLDKIAKVDFAGSGEEALEKAKTKKYDLIFLDVMMPGIDGYETCTHLRKFPQYKKTPIIMVSGKNSPLDEVKGVIAGCTTYLTKPVQPEAFQKLSRRVLTWLDNFQSTGNAPH